MRFYLASHQQLGLIPDCGSFRSGSEFRKKLGQFCFQPPINHLLHPSLKVLTAIFNRMLEAG